MSFTSLSYEFRLTKPLVVRYHLAPREREYQPVPLCSHPVDLRSFCSPFRAIHPYVSSFSSSDSSANLFSSHSPYTSYTFQNVVVDAHRMRCRNCRDSWLECSPVVKQESHQFDPVPNAVRLSCFIVIPCSAAWLIGQCP